MSLNIKVVISFLLTQVFGYGAAFASVIVPQVSIELSQTEAHAYKLEKPIYIEKALSVIVAQADTNSSIPAQKRALEQVKNDFLRFFNQYWNDHAINSFSKGYNSYKFFLLGFKSLAVDGVTVKAHHIRSLIRLTEKLLKDLAESIRYNRSEGHSNEEMKALLLLEGLCQQLVKEFLKEGYFLPLTTTEIFKDLLIYRTTELIAENKIATAALAVLVWELLGRKFDPKHEKSYSQPLTSLKELVIKKEVFKPEPVLPPDKPEPSNPPQSDKLSGQESDQDRRGREAREAIEREARKAAERKKRDHDDYRRGIIRDQNDNVIPLQPGQVGLIVSGEPLRLRAVDPATANEERVWAQQEQKQAHIVTLGELTSDVLEKQAVPLQPDGFSCGPRSLWAASKLVQNQEVTDAALATAGVELAYNFVDVDNARTLLGDELDSIIADSTKSLDLALDGEIRDGVRSGGLKDQCKWKETELSKVTQELEIYNKKSDKSMKPADQRKKTLLEKEKIDLSRTIASMKSRIFVLEKKREAINQQTVNSEAIFGPLRQAQENNQFIVLEALTGAELIKQQIERHMLDDHIKAFHAGLAQVIVLNYGHGHWITVKLTSEGGKPKCTTYDSMGSSHQHNEVLKALVFLFTEGTSYQIGKKEIPEKYTYVGQLEEFYSDEPWAQEAKRKYLAQQTQA